MYVSNLHSYGHLINEENYETTHLHNDMYNLFHNRLVCKCMFMGFCYRVKKNSYKVSYMEIMSYALCTGRASYFLVICVLSRVYN